MKITGLALDAFRSYRTTTLNLNASRVLIAGLNGSGKTSIREAIKFVLTGAADGTDAKGAGAEILIPEGTNEVSASVDLAGIGTVRRMYTESGGGSFSVEGFTGTSQAQYEGLLMKLGTTRDYLSACLNTETFLRLGHAEAKAMVLSLLNVRIPVGDKSYTLDELDMHYKQAFEDRKVAKRVLAGMTVSPKPTETLPPIEAIEAQLTKLRGQLGALRHQVGSFAGKRDALQAERIRWSVFETVLEDESSAIASLEQQLAKLEKAVVPAAPVAAAPTTNVHVLKSRVDALRAKAQIPGCVLDPQINCGTAYDVFTARAAAIIAVLPNDAPKTAPPTESPLTDIRKRLGSAQWRQQTRESALKNNQVRQERIRQIDAELKELPETVSEQAAIDAMSERIGKGEQLLASARIHYAAIATYDREWAAKDAQRLAVERLESLVDDLGPKGVRVQALADAMGRFEAAVNPYVKPFGWTISFSLDPWDVIVNHRSVVTYSRSERYRIGIALQLGIAQLSGLNFAVIDEVDMLDVATRGIVSSMLLKAPLEQILILGTREPSQALPTIPGVLTYRLTARDGQSVIAEQTAA